MGCGRSRGLVWLALAGHPRPYHLCILEGIALQINGLASALGSGRAAIRLRSWVDGGGSANDLLMQTQADLLGVPIDRPVPMANVAPGAARLARLVVGVFPYLSTIGRVHNVDKSFECTMLQDERSQYQARQQRAVERTRSRTGTK